MLWTPYSEFQSSVDNFGATYSNALLGTNVPGNASANVKGANTALLAGLAEDCYGLLIGFVDGATGATIRRQMTDILIDPAAGVGVAGSSWSVLIANLYTNGPAAVNSGWGNWFYFPIFLKAGTAIGAAHQDTAATGQALRVLVRAYGKPSRPELLKVGTKVATIGATTGTTTGVAVTPGTGGMGSYSASLGTLPYDCWWWQVGIGSADTTMTQNAYMFDVAVNATNKRVCIENVLYAVVSANEQSVKQAFGNNIPIAHGVAGEDVYVRGAGIIGGDTSMTAVAYAVGG